MKQKGIYFITADSYAAASTSPHLEIFRKNDIEVLLLTDPVDEWLVTSLSDYEEKPLKSIAKGALDLMSKAIQQMFRMPTKQFVQPVPRWVHLTASRQNRSDFTAWFGRDLRVVK